MRVRKDEEGASAVEFAIVASLLFMVLFGTIQFAIAYNRYQGLQAGAREGARLGALPLTMISQVENRVRDTVSIVDMSGSENCALNTVGSYCIREYRRTSAGATPTEISGGATQPCNLQPDGTSIVVRVDYRMQIQIPLWAFPTLNVNASGEFQCEV